MKLRRRRITLGRTVLDRKTLRRPFAEAATEHGSAIKAERLQHPPESRGPHHRPDAAEHDARTRADAMAAECGVELHHLRHHEAKRRGVVGELALNIEEIGAGDVRCLEAAAAWHRCRPRRPISLASFAACAPTALPPSA